MVSLQSLGNSSRYSSPGEQFHFCKPAKLTKHQQRNESASTPGAYRGFISHTCCSPVRGMISAAWVSAQCNERCERNRERKVFILTWRCQVRTSCSSYSWWKWSTSSSHTWTHSHSHTFIHAGWHYGSEATVRTPCVWFFSLACGYSDAGDRVTKGSGIGLLLLDQPIGREEEGACSQAEPIRDFCSSWQHTHTQTHTQRYDTGMQGHVLEWWQSHDVSCRVDCPALTDRHQTEWCRTDTHHDGAVFNVIFTFLRDIKKKKKLWQDLRRKVCFSAWRWSRHTEKRCYLLC